MITGLDINETIPYVYSKDKDKEKPTIFNIGNIIHSNKIRIFVGAFDKQGNPLVEKIQEKSLDILRGGLKSIKNLNGVDYAQGFITEDVIEMIPFEVIMEIVLKIMDINFMKDDETKN